MFQFAVVDGRARALLVLRHGAKRRAGEGDDVALEEAPKPCVGVRVVDYRHGAVRLWSLQKLHDRVRQMRQMHQYLDQPEYARHLSLDNPFVETCMPQYSLVGECRRSADGRLREPSAGLCA